MFERRLKDMDWNLPSPKWIFVFNILLFLLRVSLAKTLATIKWDQTSNFGTDGLNIVAKINDVVEIECPKTPNTTTGRQFAQYLTFTQVSRAGFEQCSTSREVGSVRLLLMCNRPFEDNSYRLLFQQDSPYPGVLTFSHGVTYYFITTSDGTMTGMSQTEGGLCESRHMKVKVEIKPKPTVPAPTGVTLRATTPAPVVTTTIATTRPTTQTTTAPPTTKPLTTGLKTTKTTDKVEKNVVNSQSAENHSPSLRHSPLLLAACSLVALLRWTNSAIAQR